ncbi:hypothetical protein ACLI4Z_13435 [Natrialbaceae archaeon A-arb3/5]
MIALGGAVGAAVLAGCGDEGPGETDDPQDDLNGEDPDPDENGEPNDDL